MDTLNINALRLLTLDEPWQNATDLAYSLVKDKKMGYVELLAHTEQALGPVAKLLVMLGSYDGQVCNGGHLQYFDNGYASEGGGCFGKHTPECPLHQELIALFEKYKFTLLPHGREVLAILKEFRISINEERNHTESCGCCGDRDCEECGGSGEVEVENQEFGCVDNQEELDKLDDRFYAINGEFEKEVDAHLKVWVETGKDPFADLPAPEEVKVPKRKPVAKLLGQDGNAHNLLAIAMTALRTADYNHEELKAIREEALSGNYDHLLQTLMKYCDVR